VNFLKIGCKDFKWTELAQIASNVGLAIRCIKASGPIIRESVCMM
jgi:hypothetical protein